MDLEIKVPLPPITKKNSQRIAWCKGRPLVLPSKRYTDFQKACEQYMPVIFNPIDEAVNVKCLYYMPTRRRVDLVNLLEATLDILVHYGVLADDNSNIVVSHDGSLVLYDKDHPRTEIYITGRGETNERSSEG